MAERLSKVARESNVGINTLVEFLQNAGEDISTNPNTRLSDEQYAKVAKKFSSDGEAKRDANKIDLKSSRKEKKVIAIEEPQEEIFKPARESSPVQGPKVLGKIDLNPKPAQKPAPKQVVEQKPAQEQKPVVEQKPVQEPVKQPEVKVEKPVKQEYNQPKGDNSAQGQVKVIGTIDLDALNQRTRPPKKSKQEK